jgi:enoyl-CoA hydratase
MTAHAVQPPQSALAQQLWIDECYANDTVADIIAALRAHEAAPANEAGDLIATRSPIALAVTLESIRRAGDICSLNEVLVQEYRVSCASSTSHDLIEGIRAQVIDKDRAPKWVPPTLAAVFAADVEARFQPLATDLILDGHPARQAFPTATGV